MVLCCCVTVSLWDCFYGFGGVRAQATSVTSDAYIVEVFARWEMLASVCGSHVTSWGQWCCREVKTKPSRVGEMTLFKGLDGIEGSGEETKELRSELRPRTWKWNSYCSAVGRRAYFRIYINIWQCSWAVWRVSQQMPGCTVAIKSSSPALTDRVKG